MTVKQWPDPHREKALAELGCNASVEWGSDQQVTLRCSLAELDALIRYSSDESLHWDCVSVDDASDARSIAEGVGFDRGHAVAIAEIKQLAKGAA